MARYRIRAYLHDKPEIEQKRNQKSQCQLCAFQKGYKIAMAMAEAYQLPMSRIGYTVEILVGAPGQWEIVWHDRMHDQWIVANHGHG